MNGQSPGLQACAIPRAGDYRFHRERRKRMGIFGLHSLAGFHWLVRETVAGTHKVSNELCVKNFYLGQPLA